MFKESLKELLSPPSSSFAAQLFPVQWVWKKESGNKQPAPGDQALIVKAPIVKTPEQAKIETQPEVKLEISAEVQNDSALDSEVKAEFEQTYKMLADEVTSDKSSVAPEGLSLRAKGMNYQELLEMASTLTSAQATKFRYQHYQSTVPIKIMLVNDILMEATDQVELDLEIGLRKEVAHLMDKMISAMKVNRGEYILSALSWQNEEGKKEQLDLLAEEILFFNPTCIIGLGATSSQMLLQTKKRLSQIHGQFFNLEIESSNKKHLFEYMPLFHPEFLMINPNMKRSAWEDIQKVMKKIGHL